MKTIKLDAFKAQTHLSIKIVDAVLAQLSIESDEEASTLEDIASHGIQGGYGSFIYYSDTIDFFNKNRLEIRKMLSSMADDLGESMLGMVKGFNCLKDLELSEDQIAECIYTDEETEDRTQILNALSWFAAEEVARAYSDFNPSNKQESES